MSKSQVPSSNDVGCGARTDRHTHTYSHRPNTEETLKSYFTSDFFFQFFFVNRIGLEVKLCTLS